jgi:hypothetical protein
MRNGMAFSCAILRLAGSVSCWQGKPTWTAIRANRAHACAHISRAAMGTSIRYWQSRYRLDLRYQQRRGFLATVSMPSDLLTPAFSVAGLTYPTASLCPRQKRHVPFLSLALPAPE